MITRRPPDRQQPQDLTPADAQDAAESLASRADALTHAPALTHADTPGAQAAALELALRLIDAGRLALTLAGRLAHAPPDDAPVADRRTSTAPDPDSAAAPRKTPPASRPQPPPPVMLHLEHVAALLLLLLLLWIASTLDPPRMPP